VPRASRWGASRFSQSLDHSLGSEFPNQQSRNGTAQS
jgi:hypothetical protein